MRPLAVEEIALAVAETAVPAQEGALALAGEEAEVLALRLAGNREAVALGQRADLGLGKVGQREAKPLEKLGGQGGEHVALVLGGVRGRRQQRPLGVGDRACVVTGDEVDCPDPVREGEHRGDPHLAVAEHAGVRGLPGGMPGEELTHHAVAEDVLEVEGEVRQPEGVGEPAGTQHRLGRAAGPGPVGLGVGPELHRHRDDIRPALALEDRRDGAVDAAGDGDQDAAGIGLRERCRRARGGREGAVDSVGCEPGGVQLCRS